jgi:hypothetical protein
VDYDPASAPRSHLRLNQGKCCRNSKGKTGEGLPIEERRRRSLRTMTGSGAVSRFGIYLWRSCATSNRAAPPFGLGSHVDTLSRYSSDGTVLFKQVRSQEDRVVAAGEALIFIGCIANCGDLFASNTNAVS